MWNSLLGSTSLPAREYISRYFTSRAGTSLGISQVEQVHFTSRAGTSLGYISQVEQGVHFMYSLLYLSREYISRAREREMYSLLYVSLIHPALWGGGGEPPSKTSCHVRDIQCNCTNSSHDLHLDLLHLILVNPAKWHSTHNKSNCFALDLTCFWTLILLCVCFYVNIYVDMYLYMYAYIYVYVYTCIYICTFIYTYM